MNINPNVNVDIERSQYADIFTPAEGYALWRDNEEGNLDENGQPICYWLTIRVPKAVSEEWAAHIWARKIDDTMEVDGKPAASPSPAVTVETIEKAAAYDVMVGDAE